MSAITVPAEQAARLVASVQRSYEAHRAGRALPVEAFGDPEELVVWLCRVAEAHGLSVDRGPRSLEAQTRIAAVLLDMLLLAEAPEQARERKAAEGAAESSIVLLQELAGGEQR